MVDVNTSINNVSTGAFTSRRIICVCVLALGAGRNTAQTPNCVGLCHVASNTASTILLNVFNLVIDISG